MGIPIIWAVLLLLGFASPSAALVVEGVPVWLETHVLRGLSAVWEEIPAEEGTRDSEQIRLETLALVARQLFTGYNVTVSAEEISGAPPGQIVPHVLFEMQNSTNWRVDLTFPELFPPVDLWFRRDVTKKTKNLGMVEEVSPLLENLPIDALTWADFALKDRIREIVERRLPGWDFSLLVRLNDNVSVLQLSFQPRQPLVLAVTPSVFSSTLPVMFQSDLKEKLAPGLFPIIGLPVEWIGLHRGDVELLARDLLEDRNAVSNTRSEVDVAFVPGQVSKVGATLNSNRFSFQIWVAAYAGVSERYPEAGIWMALNTEKWTKTELELYTEMIVDVGDFGLTNRLGLRFPVWRDTFTKNAQNAGNVLVGAEVEWPEQEVWYRVWWDSQRIRRLYAWWRYSATYGHNTALGYRIDEHISIELHYDGRYDDKLSLRGILQL